MKENVLKQRYYRKDADGNPVEDWDGLCKRVAGALATSTDEAEEFFEVLKNCHFLPNSPALMNAGRQDFSMSACFVLPVEDSMTGIFEAVKQAALVHKAGGGTGFNFSRLRPEGSQVKTTQGVASGPCSFIRVFNTATEVTVQGGKRRGANMGVLRVDHPDIEKFIALKEKDGFLGNFNISVAITDEFMEAVAADGDFALRFEGKTYKTVKAKTLWQSIIDHAWANGEPGLLFIDAVNRYNPTPHVGEFEATNPCVTGDTLVATPKGNRRADSFNVGDEVTTALGTTGEVENIEVHNDMDVYEVSFTDGGKIKVTLSHQFYAKRTSRGEFSPTMLKHLRVGDIVQKPGGVHTKITEVAYAGQATVYDLFEPTTDTWITNGYVSRGCGEQPLLPHEACVLGSVNLAKFVAPDGPEMCVNYTALGAAISTGVKMLDNIIDKQAYPLPEIESMHKSNRKIGLGVMGWADMLLLLGIRYDSDEALGLADNVMQFITEEAVNASQALALEKGAFPNWEDSLWHRWEKPMRNATVTTIAPTGSLSIIAECSSGIEPVFAWETVQRRPVGEHRVTHPIYAAWASANPGKPLPDYFVTAVQIAPEWHVKMQAAFQRHTHNAVSKTVNLPSSATKEDVESIYMTAYKTGCKGVTVYRDGSRSGQVISSADAPAASASQAPHTCTALELEAVEEAKRVKVKTSEGSVYIIITQKGGHAAEVFINSPTESKHAEVYEALARILSVALRYRVPLKSLLKQLEAANQKYGSVVSPVYAVLRAFRLLGMNGHKTKCPDCGGDLVAQEGCLKCPSCGYSKC